MSTQKHETTGELENGLVQLRFADDDGHIKDINAAEVAEALKGLVAFTSEMAKAGLFGDGLPPEVRIRPAQEGSFVLEAILMWAAANPEGAITSGITVGGALTQGINMGLRKLRGEEPSDIDYLDNGDVKINWPNNKVDQVPQQVWNRLRAMKRPTSKALRMMLAPLSDEADRLEVRDSRVAATTAEILRTEPDVVAERSDYRAAVAEPDETEERTNTFEIEATLRSIDFKRGEKWRILTALGPRQASIEDEEFLLQLDRGLALHKGDLFDVTVRELETTGPGRTKREWSLIKVTRKRQGASDDSDEPSSDPQPSDEE